MSVAGEGQPYRLLSDSLVTLLVHPAGPLVAAGHHHVITLRNVEGRVWLHEDVSRSSFELRIPVEHFVVDDPAARAQAGGAFARELPESARQGTRTNMLSEAVLDAQRHPSIVLRSVRLEKRAPGVLLARTGVEIRGATRELSVPLRYALDGERLIASGEMPIRQTDLGLTPFRVMLGALQVQDEIRASFRLVALREREEISRLVPAERRNEAEADGRSTSHPARRAGAVRRTPCADPRA